MREVLPGVWHWTAVHPNIHIEVSSYWLDGAGVLIDPLVPREEGIDWFAAQHPPVAMLLSNRHHYRESGRFAERFGCEVLLQQEWAARVHRRARGRGFEVGDSLPGGAVAVEVGAICPDDTALYLPAARAVVFADGVVSGGPHGQSGPLGFVPDSLMDDPPETRRGLLAACERLLATRLRPSAARARRPGHRRGPRAAADLVASGGRTAFEM